MCRALRVCLWVVALSFVGVPLAQAQRVPAPKEFYFDEDRGTARAVEVVPGGGDEMVDKLAAMLQRNDSRAPEIRAQLAHIAFAADRRDLGERLYKETLSSRALSPSLQRAVAWNYAWDLYHAGDVQGALAQWTALANGRPAAPDWLPPTLALALWSAGQREDAVAWYAAAVRTWPDRWNDAANFPQLLPAWREADRATLAEVFAAWRAQPPAWP
ncbi:tetratricopeptide repeat protein [Xanthomonas massiliensis]|jgi:tetratricopeptide (TPR) repeat protein|uniref:tetratricopeptide repeat protein n=1 Tax=Xanthomonas massiliensis TaxID=1720302 RepID=UPI000824226F|nr:hypothetical protein [Xanthomonas massiliensis]